MRATVAQGAGQGANVAGAAVYGQVGTAPLAGAPGKWVSWFLGFRSVSRSRQLR